MASGIRGLNSFSTQWNGNAFQAFRVQKIRRRLRIRNESGRNQEDKSRIFHEKHGYNPVMAVLRFLMLLSLIAWIGGLLFFAFVLAPTAFNIPAVLPNTHLAGNVIRATLSKLHWLAIGSGVVFLISSVAYSRLAEGTVHLLSVRHGLVYGMLGLTAFSQFWIIPQMDKLREAVGDFSAVAVNNPLRVQFDALHVWSTRVEGAVLLLGLVLVYTTAQALARR